MKRYCLPDYSFDSYEQGMADANILQCGPGMRYTSVATAVAAAVAAGADSDTAKTIQDDGGDWDISLRDNATFNATTNVVTCASITLADGARVTFKGCPGSTVPAGTLPTGITANVVYYVTQSTGSTFQLLDDTVENDGQLVDFTTNGTGTIRIACIDYKPVGVEYRGYPRPPVRSSGGSIDIYELPQERWQTSFPGALIGVVADDAVTQWNTTDATFVYAGTNRSARMYAWYYGIPITYGVVVYNAINEVSGYMTPDNLRHACQSEAAEIMSQSYTHAVTAPSTFAEMYREFVASRDALEGMTDDSWTTPNRQIGEIVRGYSDPGYYHTVDGFDQRDCMGSKMIRETYQWSHGYSFGNIDHVGGDMLRHHTMRYALDAISDFDTLAGAKTWLFDRAHPGMRILINVETPITHKARFANLCQAYKAIAFDRTTYPGRAMMAVTASMLHNAMQFPAYYDATGVLIVPPGPGFYEDWSAWAAGDITTYTTTKPGISISRRSDAGANTASIATDGANQVLQFTPGTVTSPVDYCMLGMTLAGLPGRKYKLWLRMRRTVGTTNPFVYTVCSYKTQGSGPDNNQVSYTMLDNLQTGGTSIAIDDNWTWYEIPVTIPTFAMAISIFLQCNGAAVTSPVYQIDQITVQPC